ncbi:MAG: LacI family transcriptional regulator, partial [Planctomycetaceae bacterium]
MATRRDVAALAGVSTTSVTNVITGRRQVGEAIRRRVQEAVRALEYRPHQMARALATRNTKQVAIVGRFISNPFYGVLLQELTDDLQAVGLRSIAFNSAFIDAETISEALTGQVDGIAVLDGSLPLVMVQEFLAKGIPVAAQGYEGCADIPSVEPDFAGGMDQIVEHLVNLGHTRIAF